MRSVSKGLHGLKETLTKSIISIYDKVNDDEQVLQFQEEVIVLDYLVTLRQLLGLLQNNDLEGFHAKSKI